MKVLGNTYTVELTSEEINVIVDALHVEYIRYKDSLEENHCKSSEEARTLRNAFCRLVGRSYMGADA